VIRLLVNFLQQSGVYDAVRMNIHHKSTYANR